MKNLTKKGFLNKLIIVFLVIIVFNAVFPMNKSQAGNYVVGGSLLKPIIQLILKIGDGIVDFIHKVIFDSSSSILEFDISNNWKKLVIVVGVIVGIIGAMITFVAIPGIFAGLSTLASSVGIAAASATTYEVVATVIKIEASAITCAVMYINTTWFGDVAVLPIYKISPQEIFRGEIAILNSNFFNASEEIEHWYDDGDSYNNSFTNYSINELNEYLAGYGCTEKLADGSHDVKEDCVGVVTGHAGKDEGTVYDSAINYLNYSVEWSKNNVKYMAIISGNFVLEMSQEKYIADTVTLRLLSDTPSENASTPVELYSDTLEEPIASRLKPTITKWYYTIRNLAIVLMLLELAYIGIRIMLCSIASEKAKYKDMLKDWIVAICLIFIMHYIMAFASNLVDSFTELVSSIDSERRYVVYIGDDDGKLRTAIQETNSEISLDGLKIEGNNIAWNCNNLMGLARYQASLQGSDVPGVSYIGFTIAFLVMVFYTIFFLVTYMKRVIYLAFLTMIAPMVAFTYPLDKINDGKAQAFDMWLKEYIFNLLLQPFHLILYTVLIGSAFDLASTNILYTLVAMGFLMPAERLLRKFFGFEKAQTPGMLGGAVGASVLMNGMNKLLHGKPPKKSEEESSGKKIKESKNFDDVTSNEGVDESLLYDSESFENSAMTEKKPTTTEDHQPAAGVSPLTGSQKKHNGIILPGELSPEEQAAQNEKLKALRQSVPPKPKDSGQAKKPSTAQATNSNNNKTTGPKNNPNRKPSKFKRRLRGGLGLAQSYAGQQFKGAAEDVEKLVRKIIRKKPKMAAGAALGVTAGMLGVALGIASGDISKVAQYGGVAMAGGYSLGGNLEEFAAGVMKVDENELQDSYDRSYYENDEEYKQAKLEERTRKYLNDDRHIEEVQRYTGGNKEYARIVLEQNRDCIDAGIENVKDILAVDNLVNEEGWSREKAITAIKGKPIENMSREEYSDFVFNANRKLRAQGVKEENLDMMRQQMEDNYRKANEARKGVTKGKNLTNESMRNERMRNYYQNIEEQKEREERERNLERYEKKREREIERKNKKDNPEK